MTDRIPSGWLTLVSTLRTAVERDFPGVAVIELTGDRGWLHVRCDDDRLSPPQMQRLNRMLQGFITQSLSTCMSCGSHHGRERGGRRRVTCDGCENEDEACHA
ncbi:hypothetical protein M2281_002758 [Mesorhizobium soli]|uniref:hypothetical protein n=1 Tax=Pseudaminobacter soli (ex Li et al. 2025) TaxID=1295366 RepID=UPI002474A473|nr:hypothetical protein [Mesorhizobium soli]MDH6232160.1 hypothetical protein [Mesorhizobium soli]